MSIPGYVLPGQIICPIFEKINTDSGITIRKFIPGNGVGLSQEDTSNTVVLRANKLGKVGLAQVAEEEKSEESEGTVKPKSGKGPKIATFKVFINDRFTLCSAGPKPKSGEVQASPVVTQSVPILPTIGSVVLARVTKLTLRQANVEIISIQSTEPDSVISTGEDQNNAVKFSSDVPVSKESAVGVNGLVRGVVPSSQVTTSGSGVPTSFSFLSSSSISFVSPSSVFSYSAKTTANTSSSKGRNAQLTEALTSQYTFQGTPQIPDSTFVSNSVSSTEIGEGFGGIIRLQDVRLTQRDTVKISECFQPGDIVKALVISLGDGTNYYLSTARNDLGVILAKARGSGKRMVPVDWQYMKTIVPESQADRVAEEIEMRKCAKPL